MTIETINSRILSAPFSLIDRREAKTITTLLSKVAEGLLPADDRAWSLDLVLDLLRKDVQYLDWVSNREDGDVVRAIITDIELQIRQNEWSN